MSNELMGPPLPKRASMNRSLAPPDPEEQFILTPKKIENVLSKFTPSKLESPPQRIVVVKPVAANQTAGDEDQRPPWNNDIHVLKGKHSPGTPFTRNVLGEVNQLRGTKAPKSFERRLKESQENVKDVTDVNALSDYMSKLSTDVKEKDGKIKKLGMADKLMRLEENLLQVKRELNQLKSTANSRQVEWVETLRSETEVRQRMEIELSQLKAKMEIEKQNSIKGSAMVVNLQRELSYAFSLMNDEQKGKFRSRIPQI